MVNTRSVSSYKLRSRSILKSIPSSSEKATPTSRNNTLSDADRKRLIESLVPKSDMVYDEHYKKQCWECANCAIEHYNELASKKGETMYELVDLGISTAFSGHHRENRWYFHCNFRAKPISDHSDYSESETKLFFGEVKQDYAKPFTGIRCCILGTPGCVFTSDNGCVACHPGTPIHHPPDGGFNVGEEQMLLSPRPRPPR